MSNKIVFLGNLITYDEKNEERVIRDSLLRFTLVTNFRDLERIPRIGEVIIIRVGVYIRAKVLEIITELLPEAGMNYIGRQYVFIKLDVCDSGMIQSQVLNIMNDESNNLKAGHLQGYGGAPIFEEQESEE